MQRLDAVLRSSLYSHFSESLSGLATIRAYGETKRFQSDNERFVDVENRAYWLTVVNQVRPLLQKKACSLIFLSSDGSVSGSISLDHC
jgi:Flp pilus assembly CpaE family ATPase